MKIAYRPEIDGLRALAVVAVILYHAEIHAYGLTWFSGGFLGVDVFFVISGYLITKLILLEIRQCGRFDYGRFFERRARRILPMLFTTMLAALPFAWFTLLPTALTEYARSMLSSVFFGSNIFFYFSTTGYGADTSLLKPLLHTWSLSVEEQFYLTFPFLLVISERYLRKRAPAALILLAAASLSIMAWVSRSDPSLAFFMLPSRAWELLAGALLAYSEIKKGTRELPPSSAAFSTAGLLLIVFAFGALDEETQHPGLATFLPVIGTVLVIRYAGALDLVGRLLSTRLLVGIGLISYSLYLWHYPIFSFSRLSLVYFSLNDKLIAIALTFVLALLSYRFIEQPFRDRQRFGRKTAIGSMALTAMLLSGIASTVDLKEGEFGRYAHLKSLLADYEPDNEKLLDETWILVDAIKRRAKFEPPDRTTKVLIVGNSHSKDLYNVFMTNAGLFTEFGFSRYPMQLADFHQHNKQAGNFFRSAAYRKADVIFVSTRYLRKRRKAGGLSDIEGLEFLAKRTLLDDKILVVANNTVEFFWDGTKTLYDSLLWQASADNGKANTGFFETVNQRYFLERNKARAPSEVDEINREIADLAQIYDFTLLKKEDYLCDFSRKICFGATDGGHKAFYDYGHYTMQGAAFFGRRIHQIGWLKPLEEKLSKRRQTSSRIPAGWPDN